MKFVVALVASLYAAVSAQDAPSDIAAKYMELPTVPGMDFVGFGYDVRYLDDPNQGVRLPLIDYGYQRQKRYAYPLYRNRIYKVPDELFVRTVATATAENYEFSDIEEYKENWGAQLGFKYERSSTVAIEPDKPNTTNSAASQGQGANNDKPSMNQGMGNATNNQRAGMMPTLPSQYAKSSSGVFELGIDFQFRKNSMRNKDQVTVENRQTHQLYQLLVSNQNLRVSMEKDIKELTGRKYLAEKSLFKAFFEKYGTHYVQSAMLGGAIEMKSTTSNTKITDYLHITANATLLLASNSTTETDNTTKEEWVRDHAACTGAQGGYIYNTLTKECAIPPEATCWSPMDKEKFSDGFNYDPVKLQDITKPDPLSFAKLMDKDNAEQVKKGQVDGKPALFDSKAIREAYVKQPWRYGPDSGVARSCNTNRVGATICDFGKMDHFTVEAQLPSENQHLRVDGTGVTSEAGQKGYGVTRYWESSNPGMIEWKAFFDSMPQGHTSRLVSTKSTVFSFVYDGDQVTSTDDKVLFAVAVYGNGNDNYRIGMWNVAAETQAANPPRHQATLDYYSVVPDGEWINFRAVMNWEKYTLRLWFKSETMSEWKLVTSQTLRDKVSGRDFPFRHEAARLDRMDIFNFAPGSGISLIDDIKFCNDAKGAKYAPMTRGASVAKSTSNMRSNIQGTLDFGFANTMSSIKIEESSNYKLKGGDSSIVDLLNLRNKLETFTTWKASIPKNPAPVSFSLRSMAYLFSRDPVDLIPAVPSQAPSPGSSVNPRAEMSEAIDDFLNTKEVGEILYTKAADTPSDFELSGRVAPPVEA